MGHVCPTEAFSVKKGTEEPDLRKDSVFTQGSEESGRALKGKIFPYGAHIRFIDGNEINGMCAPWTRFRQKGHSSARFKVDFEYKQGEDWEI